MSISLLKDKNFIDSNSFTHGAIYIDPLSGDDAKIELRNQKDSQGKQSVFRISCKSSGSVRGMLHIELINDSGTQNVMSVSNTGDLIVHNNLNVVGESTLQNGLGDTQQTITNLTNRIVQLENMMRILVNDVLLITDDQNNIAQF